MAWCRQGILCHQPDLPPVCLELQYAGPKSWLQVGIAVAVTLIRPNGMLPPSVLLLGGQRCAGQLCCFLR